MAKLKINKERCKGCGLCVITCSKKLITLTGPTNNMGLKTASYKWSKECGGCALCAMMCPDCAIEVWK
jgi:2-oxoglutarate ferredoxin oxidoreductase subunit delta